MRKPSIWMAALNGPVWRNVGDDTINFKVLADDGKSGREVNVRLTRNDVEALIGAIKILYTPLEK